MGFRRNNFYLDTTLQTIHENRLLSYLPDNNGKLRTLHSARIKADSAADSGEMNIVALEEEWKKDISINMFLLEDEKEFKKN